MLEGLLDWSHTPSLSEALAREVGRSVAHATVAAGPPNSYSDMADGRRAYYWRKASSGVPRGPKCTFTVYAVLDGRPDALAAWEIVMVEPSPSDCGHV